MNRRLLFLILILGAILRFYNLSNNPPSLYWDEASIGYNAFSILSNGTDEHGVKFPLTHFLAYGDAKSPLYIYATSVSMAVFGINEFSVRLPSALAGTIAIAITYYLVKEIFHSHKKSTTIALFSSLLLAISPWHLQMSRAGFEANLALTLFLAGLLLFFKSKLRPEFLVLSSFFFALTFYTFNSYRIFLPLFLIFLAVIYRKHLTSHFRWTVASSAIGLLIVAPLIPFLLSSQARLRFDEVTIFKNHAPITEANLRNQLNGNSAISRIIHNRRFLFTLDFLKHYTDQFKPDFLFISGDNNPRLATRDQGMLYAIELPLILVGIYASIKLHNKSTTLLFLWIFLSFIPAGIARETPHALRSLQLLPVPQILLALGIVTLISKYKFAPRLIILTYAILLISYLDTYHLHYPNYWSHSWQYGYKQLVELINPIQDNYNKIFITKKLGRPHTYFLFHTQYPTKKYLSNRDASGDAFGFTYVNGFDKYRFGDIEPLKTRGSESWLIVSGADGMPSETSELKTIYDLNQEPVFIVSELK